MPEFRSERKLQYTTHGGPFTASFGSHKAQLAPKEGITHDRTVRYSETFQAISRITQMIEAQDKKRNICDKLHILYSRTRALEAQYKTNRRNAQRTPAMRSAPRSTKSKSPGSPQQNNALHRVRTTGKGATRTRQEAVIQQKAVPKGDR